MTCLQRTQGMISELAAESAAVNTVGPGLLAPESRTAEMLQNSGRAPGKVREPGRRVDAEILENGGWFSAMLLGAGRKR